MSSSHCVLSGVGRLQGRLGEHILDNCVDLETASHRHMQMPCSMRLSVLDMYDRNCCAAMVKILVKRFDSHGAG